MRGGVAPLNAERHAGERRATASSAAISAHTPSLLEVQWLRLIS